MDMRKVVIACEDVFGIEVYSILKAVNLAQEREGRPAVYALAGYVSDAEDPFGALSLPIPRLGTLRDWRPAAGETCVLGIKSPAAKKAAVARLRENGVSFETVIAPWVRGPMGMEIGEGSILSAYSCANGVHIGNFVTLISPMLSGHQIGDYSTVMRFSNIAGEVGTEVLIGNHVFVPLDKKIGDGAVVEDGAIVTMSIRPGSRVSGVPAKRVRK